MLTILQSDRSNSSIIFNVMKYQIEFLNLQILKFKRFIFLNKFEKSGQLFR